jgi:hypothetical protein
LGMLHADISVISKSRSQLTYRYQLNLNNHLRRKGGGFHHRGKDAIMCKYVTC